MRYNINRRKFLELFGCSCCSVFTASCGTVPITERKQLTLYPESVINNHAAKAYAKLKNSKKIKLITKGKDLESLKILEKKLLNQYLFSFKNKELPIQQKILIGNTF